MVDPEEVEDATAALLAAATDVSASTRASYDLTPHAWTGGPLLDADQRLQVAAALQEPSS
jgi:hypothetical protein